MTRDPIPNIIKRVIITSVESVPHLEALLMTQKNPEVSWDAELLARTIFIQPKVAEGLLVKLSSAGFLKKLAESQPQKYDYVYPVLETRQLLDELAALYSKHLILITNLIHDKSSNVQKFADAFKF
ncbi:MAG: hypothetical protein C0417_07125 [Chlorobiaceae bacterium]|nr:hypothetical protein [Chlorobiaceae bacterium]